MKPVDQTRFGWPHGNCYAACVASILEIRIEACPETPDPETWDATWDAWLNERNLARIVFTYNRELAWPGWQILCGPTDTLGPHGENLWHACVGLNGELIHDPNPTRGGFLNGEIRQVEILYLLNPATGWRRA